jgi:hypothetical protein
MPGGRPVVFNAEILLLIGEHLLLMAYLFQPARKAIFSIKVTLRETEGFPKQKAFSDGAVSWGFFFVAHSIRKKS